MRRIVIRSTIGLLILAVVAWLVFDPVMEAAVPALARVQFVGRYSRANADQLAPVFDSHDWAVQFGGDLGRPALENLTTDESLTQEGRDKARSILFTLDTPEFHQLLAWEAESDSCSWLKRRYLRWLLRQEQKRRPNSAAPDQAATDG